MASTRRKSYPTKAPRKFRTKPRRRLKPKLNSAFHIGENLQRPSEEKESILCDASDRCVAHFYSSVCSVVKNQVVRTIMRKMSDSVMMPTRLPFSSTGNPPILFSSMMRAASRIVVLGSTVITLCFMILSTFNSASR